MGYSKQTFIDRVVDSVGNIVTEGTKIKAAHFQNIEQGILDNEEKIEKKQDSLVSGQNIKTLNGQSLLGSGNLTIEGGSVDANLYEEAKKHISRFHHQYMRNVKLENVVDIVVFAGQSNSCGRAVLEDVETANDVFVTVPIEKGFTFNNTKSTTPLKIEEPITENGSSAYGYIPAFINAYYETTGKKVCACYKSYGGAMMNKWSPYVLDQTTGEETATVGTFYQTILDAVKHAKTNLVSNGYVVGDVFMVWCQGEADAAYLGNENTYANEYEKTLTTDEAKQTYYKERFSRIVEKLQEDVELTTAFIIRIGHSATKQERNTVIIEAQNQLCKENPNCVMVSTIFAGALKFVEEDGTTRDLMRDASHYVPEGYLRAGMEAGINAGIYNNSNKLVKPILLEYHTLKREDTAEHERSIDQYIYDPCRIDLSFMKSLAENVATTAIELTALTTEVAVNKTLNLSCNFTPANATDTDLLYVSSSNAIATVSETGVVTGITTGNVTITATLASNSSISSTISLTVVEETSGGDTEEEPSGEVVFDFDFTTNNLDDYALDSVFTIPSNSTTSTITYNQTYGMSLNNNLPNGLNLVEPIDASKAWTLEFTAFFVTPTVLAGNRRAFLGGDNLYPFVFINGTTFENMGFQISNGTHATVGYGKLVYDKECDYKIVYNGNGKVTAYADGVEIGTGSVNFDGQQFTVMLGNVTGKSSAYVWQNVESKPSYLHKMKFYYND